MPVSRPASASTIGRARPANRLRARIRPALPPVPPGVLLLRLGETRGPVVQLRIRTPSGSNGGSGRTIASRISPRISIWKPPARPASSAGT